MNALRRHVVTEALHDSGERFPEPACHPGTRTTVLKQLKSWAMATRPESTILWLHGSAGVGKSAIAQTFAGECQSLGRLGASFFFKRGHPKRGSWHGLVQTIAYQLAKFATEFLLPLQQVLDDDPLVVGRAMTVQFKRLLFEPLTHSPALDILPIIVLDGLDECAEHKVQQEILRLFIGAIRNDQLFSRFRILISSRPEPHLREIFESTETLGILGQSTLSADRATFDDIGTYLVDQLSRIRREYLARGIDLGEEWPSADALNHLVEKSSGIFVYATTVVRFVDDEYSHPGDRLESVLRLDAESTAPLDDLYSEILSAVPCGLQQLRVLHAIWEGTRDGANLGPEEIDMLLNLRQGTVRLVLRGLHSLLYVPPIQTRFVTRRFGRPRTIGVLHASFPDYLSDPRRSGPWCVSMPELHSEYLHCMIRLLSSAPTTQSTQSFYRYISAPPRKHLMDIQGAIEIVAEATERHDAFRDSD
jgi:hypothetical protein